MDMIAALEEMIEHMEEDIEAKEFNCCDDATGRGLVVGYIRTLRTLLKASQPKATTDSAGVAISIGGSHLPQQLPTQLRPNSALHGGRDPWEEARRKGRKDQIHEPESGDDEL